MEIFKLQKSELKEALELVLEVFMEFEAPEYALEGVAEFQRFIEYGSILERVDKGTLLFWGCRVEGALTGVLAVRDKTHICLLFVRRQFHRRGIARRLFETALEYFRGEGCAKILVNSSPYAVEAYRRLGFADTDTEQTVNGIRFVPMEYGI